MRKLYCSVVTKQELSNTAKLSVFKLVFVPILTYGYESWVMTRASFCNFFYSFQQLPKYSKYM